MEGCTISNEGQAGRTSQNTSEGWKSKTVEVLAALRRQDEERRLEIEQMEMKRRKKRERWDAEWRRMFDSFQGQGSDGEKPQVMSATVLRSEARANGIVVSSAAVVQAHLDGGVEAASMTARDSQPRACELRRARKAGDRQSFHGRGDGVVENRSERGGYIIGLFCRCSSQCCCIGSGITGRSVW